MTIAAPRYLLAVWTEHNEAIKLAIEGDLLQTGSINVDHENIERKSNGALVIAAK